MSTLSQSLQRCPPGHCQISQFFQCNGNDFGDAMEPGYATHRHLPPVAWSSSIERDCWNSDSDSGHSHNNNATLGHGPRRGINRASSSPGLTTFLPQVDLGRTAHWAGGATSTLNRHPAVRGRSALSNVSSNISPSPLYIPPHRR